MVERDLAALGAELLVSVIDDLAAGRIAETPQNDADATYAPRLTKEEGRIDWSRSAADLHNRVRGLRPWPAAYTFLHERRLVVHQSRVAAADVGDAVPGDLCRGGRNNHRGVRRRLRPDLLAVQPEGRRVMAARDFAAGHGRLKGQRFG